MAVTNVTRIRDGESATNSGKATERTYRYHIYVDDPEDDCDIALTADDLPEEGSTVYLVGYEETSQTKLTVKNVKVEHVEGTPLLFVATVSCGPYEGPDADGDVAGVHPVWDVEVSIDGIPYEIPLLRDLSGTPIVNAAGAIIKGITQTKYDEEIVISFKTSSVPSVVDGMRGSINEQAINMDVNGYTRTFAAETLKLVKAPIRTIATNRRDLAHPLNPRAWSVSFTFLYRAETWRTKAENKGTYWYDETATDGHPKKQFKVRDGETVIVEERYLDLDGHELAPNTPADPYPDRGVGQEAGYDTAPLEDFQPLFNLLSGVLVGP